MSDLSTSHSLSLAPSRFISLDVFRGLTIILMIYVNTSGSFGLPAFFSHVGWDGCTGADCIFPFFLFIVGASIWFSTRKTRHQLSWGFCGKALKRAIYIFGLGLLLNWFPFEQTVDNVRLVGVLQRIAIVFFLGSILALWLKTYRRIFMALCVLLLGSWGLLWVSDGLINNNLGQHIYSIVDVWLLGSKHVIWREGVPFDPESLLGAIPSIGNALLGYMAAMFMGTGKLTLKRVFSSGTMGVAGILLSLWWNEYLPFNKQLWTSSFVLYTSSWAIVIWSIFAMLMDVFSFKCLRFPWIVFGTNAIFAYVLSILLVKINYLISFGVEGQTMSPSTWWEVSLLKILGAEIMSYNLWGISLIIICFLLTLPLYRAKIYVRL